MQGVAQKMFRLLRSSLISLLFASVAFAAPVNVPNLQQVTTAGATSNKDTTFSGGLRSNGAGSGSTIFGTGVSSAGAFDFTAGNTVTSSNSGGATGGTTTLVGTVIFSDSFKTSGPIGNAAFGVDIDIKGSFNTAFGESIFIANTATILADEATTNTSMGFGNTMGLRTSSNVSLGSSITHSADVANSIGIGKTLALQHSNAILIGSSLTSSAAWDFQLGEATHLYNMAGTFPTNNTLRFGNSGGTGNATIKYDGTNLAVDPKAVGSGLLAVTTKITSPDGFYMTTTGGAAARIPVNSYGFAIDAAPTSGVYFNNSTKNIEIHGTGVAYFGWNIGAQVGHFFASSRTAAPTGGVHPINGGLYVHDDGAGYYALTQYDGTQWRPLGSQYLQQGPLGTPGIISAGSGTAVLDDSTFDGGLGGSAYDLNDIVAALINMGAFQP